jgi:hypothetical protein
MSSRGLAGAVRWLRTSRDCRFSAECRVRSEPPSPARERARVRAMKLIRLYWPDRAGVMLDRPHPSPLPRGPSRERETRAAHHLGGRRSVGAAPDRYKIRQESALQSRATLRQQYLRCRIVVRRRRSGALQVGRWRRRCAENRQSREAEGAGEGDEIDQAGLRLRDVERLVGREGFKGALLCCSAPACGMFGGRRRLTRGPWVGRASGEPRVQRNRGSAGARPPRPLYFQSVTVLKIQLNRI